MLKRIEDITVISGQEFVSCEEDMLFVDTESPFSSQPLVQVFIALSEAETELPDTWQESSLFGGDVVITYEEGTIHTFISVDIQEQMAPEQYLFIKVIAIGEG